MVLDIIDQPRAALMERKLSDLVTLRPKLAPPVLEHTTADAVARTLHNLLEHSFHPAVLRPSQICYSMPVVFRLAVYTIYIQFKMKLEPIPIANSSEEQTYYVTSPRAAFCRRIPLC